MDSLVSCRQKVDSCKKKKCSLWPGSAVGGKGRKNHPAIVWGAKSRPFPLLSLRSVLQFFLCRITPFFAFSLHLRAWSQPPMDWTHSCTHKSSKQYEKEWRNIPEQDMFHRSQISRWFLWSANTHWEHSGKKNIYIYLHICSLIQHWQTLYM